MQTEREKIFSVVFFLIISLIFISLLFYTPKLVGFITSTVVYINSGPTFDHSNPIANQSLVQGNSLSDVFDLDNYFSDSDGDTLTYEAFGNSSVTVSIDTSNVVSYSAGSSFSGSEVIKFVGDDGVRRNATSNNVTITVNETGAVTPQVTGAASGGGGGGRVQGPDFVIDKEELKVKLKQGETKEEFIKIKNNLQRLLSILIDLEGVKDFLSPEEESLKTITLNPKSEELVPIDFFASEDVEPDVYVKSINISTENTEKELPVVLDVSSKEILFDLSLKLEEKFRKISPGKKIEAIITIFKPENIEGAEVLVNLLVQDFTGNIIVEKNRSVSLHSTVQIKEEIILPPDIKSGKYLLVAKTKYADQIAVVSKTFEVAEEITDLFFYLIFSILIIIIVLLTIFITIILKRAQKSKIKVNQKDLDDIYELILIAKEYVALKDKRKAIEIYRKIKKKFDKLPTLAKRGIFPKVNSLAKSLGQ